MYDHTQLHSNANDPTADEKAALGANAQGVSADNPVASMADIPEVSLAACTDVVMAGELADGSELVFDGDVQSPTYGQWVAKLPISLTADEKAAIVGTSGTPVSAENPFVDNADPRLAPHNHNLADLTERSYNSLTDKPTLGSAAAKNIGSTSSDVAQGNVIAYAANETEETAAFDAGARIVIRTDLL
jgi:hypothetical protein